MGQGYGIDVKALAKYWCAKARKELGIPQTWDRPRALAVDCSDLAAICEELVKRMEAEQDDSK